MRIGVIPVRKAKTHCENCPAGKYGDEVGLSYNCKACSPGKYSRTELSPVVSCQKGDRGYYAPDGGLSQKPCEPGQYTNESGSVGVLKLPFSAVHEL